jgi:hypothetical protein
MRSGRIFYIIVLLICIFETARLWNISPGQMVAHFNIQGNPDRFVSKAEFFWFELQTMMVVIGTSIPLQLLFAFLPPNLINMPNREYWLAPERRDETIGRLNSFSAMMFGVILLAIHAVFEISVYANLQTPIFFNAKLMLFFMVASFAVIGWMLFRLMASFHLPSSQD